MTTVEINEPATVARRNYRESVLLALAFVLVGWFDAWTLESTGRVWNFGLEQNDYYNLLLDGWLDGQLHMKVEVPDALLKLRDPYDPSQRPPGVGLHDASFYHGKYYVYFGAAPLVVLMLPFRLITGIDLPVAFATLAFVYAGFLASAAVWLQIRRRYFNETGAAVAVIGVLALGLGSLSPILLRRPQMWELPIAAGYCFVMLALWCVGRSLHAERSRVAWFTGSAVALGLAIASRPTYLFATPLLAIPLLVWWREGKGLPWREATAAVLPLAAIGALMAAHNYLRFDHPLEFGQTYQLTYFDETKVPHFSASYVGFNGWRYFFSRAQWSLYFPFIAPADLPPKPPGFSGHDDVYGVLANLPLGWFALLAPLALLNRAADERRRLGAWLAAVAVVFVVMAGVLLGFFGSLARYEVDFAPALMLLACVGVLALERLTAPRVALWRRTSRAAWGAAALIAIGFAVLFTLQYDGQLQRHNPAKAAAVARLLNWIPYGLERGLGVKHGGVEMEMVLRPRANGAETLLTIGDAPNVDAVLVRHVDATQVQFIVAPARMPEIASRPLAIDFGRPHAVRMKLGSLLPPETHPMFRHRTEAELAELTREIRVELDGETIIDERRELSKGARRLRVGRDAVAPPEARLAGEAAKVRRLEIGALKNPDSFMRLRFSLPSVVAASREPLIAFQDAATGGVLLVHYLDDAGRIAFGTSVGGERSVESAPVVVDPARAHEVVVRTWSTGDRSTQRIELRLAGVIVWSQTVRWPGADAVFLPGRNVSNEPGCASRFSGRIHSVQHAPDGRDPLWSTPGDQLKLRVQLPVARPGAREPLVVTGRTEAGDLLMIEYVDARTVRFGLDHWGGPTLFSEPVPVDFAKPHEITVATTALWGPSAQTPLRMTRKGALRIQLDGTEVWRTPAPTFVVRPDEIAVGTNPIGGTSASARFTGDILSAERVRR